MQFDKFTMKSQELFQAAHDLANQLNHPAIDPLHFLDAMLGDDQGVVLSILRKIGAQPPVLKQALTRKLEGQAQVTGAADRYLSRESRKMLDMAFAEAEKMKDLYVSLEHILLAMTQIKDAVADLFEQQRGNKGFHTVSFKGYQGEPAGDGSESGRALPGPGKVWPGSDPAGPDRWTGSGDRPG